MKLKNIFEEEFIEKELVMVSLNNDILNGIIRANESASYIISCLKESTTPSEIANKMSERYSITKETANEAVSKIVTQLRKLNLIEEM